MNNGFFGYLILNSLPLSPSISFTAFGHFVVEYPSEILTNNRMTDKSSHNHLTCQLFGDNKHWLARPYQVKFIVNT